MRKYQNFLLALLTMGLGFSTEGRSQARSKPPLSFNTLNALGGLTGDRTRCVTQDSWGEIWIGTQNGLNRYNGYEVIQYQQIPHDTFSLPDNFINALAEDSHQQLWIGSAREGLSRYDPVQDRFFKAVDARTGQRILPGITVRSLLAEPDGKLWVGSRRGLSLCQVEAGGEIVLLKHFAHTADDPQSLTAGLIMDMVRSDAQTLWVGSYRGGLDRLVMTPDDTLISHFPAQPAIGFDPSYLHDLHMDQTGRLWVGANAMAYWIAADELIAAAPTLHPFPLAQYSPGSAGSINGFASDTAGRLWMISNGQLHAYWPEQDTLLTYQQDELGFEASGNNSLIDLMVDADQRLWVCAMEGLYYQNGRLPGFRQLLPETWQEGLTVRAVWEDTWGYQWLGTESEGLLVLDPAGDLVLQASDQRGPLNSYFVSALFMQADEIWIGQVQGGVQRFQVIRSASGRPIRLLKRGQLPAALRYQSVEDMVADDTGQIWLATLGGLWRYHEDPDSLRHYRVRWGHEIAQDTEGRLWLATAMGLFTLDETGDTLRRYIHHAQDGMRLDRQIFNTLLADAEGYLWAGTPHGLYRLKEGAPLMLMRTQEGLAGNLVQSLVLDGEGQLWIGTQKGLSKLNRSSLQIHNFYQADGIPHRVFADRATRRGPSGAVLMGGDQGLLRFDPARIEVPGQDVPVAWTRMEVLGRAVAVRSPLGSAAAFELVSHIRLSPAIRLQARDKSFSLYVAGLAYGYAHRMQYRYQMQGFDTDWTALAPGQRRIHFTNLDPGEYVLKVEGSLDGLHWGAANRLTLRIEPPWYRTWWAFLLYSFGVSLLIGGIFYRRIQKVQRAYETQARIETAREAERELVRRNSARDFHDEAGNKLTKLSLYTELTRRAVAENPQAQTYLQQIESNLAALSTGMRDFIWVLNPENDLLSDSLERLAAFGHGLFDDTETTFKADLSAEALRQIHLDIRHKRHLLLIFKEAMHNTAKYAQAKQAYITANIEGAEFVIGYRDDGQGFDIQEVRMGNGLNNMHARAREIGAEFHLKSQVGGGTHIELRAQNPSKGA